MEVIYIVKKVKDVNDVCEKGMLLWWQMRRMKKEVGQNGDLGIGLQNRQENFWYVY